MWKGDFFLWRGEFFKIGKRDFTFIREMRVVTIASIVCKSVHANYDDSESFY